MFSAISFVVGISFIFGILLAIIILVIARHGQQLVGGPAQRPTALGWCTLGFGLTAATAFALTIWWPISSNIVGRGLNMISIAFAVAALVVGIGNLLRRDRHWPTWVGIIAGLIPGVFWTAFAAASSFSF